jgi:choline dehydrogenase-like flavoprotein
VAIAVFEVDPTLPTPTDLASDPGAASKAREEYFKSRTGPLATLPASMSYHHFSQVMSQTELTAIVDELSTVVDKTSAKGSIQWNRFDPESNLGQIELLSDLGNWSPFLKPEPGKKYASVLAILQYPFSKGNIHIGPTESGSPATIDYKPIINPRYYEGSLGKIDLDTMVHSIRYGMKIFETAPLSGIIRNRVWPPASVVAEPDLRAWVTQNSTCDWHPVGTCAMGGKEGAEGGVVDDRLRVFGVRGLRVIDASVIPLQVSAHLQATVYAIAEKGAQLILDDLNLGIQNG